MTTPTPKLKPLRIFYVYAHEDERLRAKLEIALALLRQQGLIQEWHDRKIGAGQDWQREIDTHLEAADIMWNCVPSMIALSIVTWRSFVSGSMRLLLNSPMNTFFVLLSVLPVAFFPRKSSR